MGDGGIDSCKTADCRTGDGSASVPIDNHAARRSRRNGERPIVQIDRSNAELTRCEWLTGSITNPYSGDRRILRAGAKRDEEEGGEYN
jgi:hypothetical protein